MTTSRGAVWAMKGQVIIACNCDYGCPCNFNGLPSTGSCEGGWTWRVEKGAHGDVALDGLNVGLYASWPGAIHEGDGKAVYLIDERADQRQRNALDLLLGGSAGGPWAVFRSTFREFHGPRYVRYEVDGETPLPRVRAGDAIAVDMEYIRNPVTRDTIHPRIALPEGMVVKEAALVGTRLFSLADAELRYEHSGRYGAVGFFQYTGP